MKIWKRGILFVSVVSTLESINYPAPGECFFSRLVDEVSSSDSLGPAIPKDNVQTQSKHQFHPSRIYSQTRTSLGTPNIELEDFRRAGKSKRRFEGVFSTQAQGAQAMTQNPWAQAEFNWDFDNLGSTSYHLGRTSNNDISEVWNNQHQNSPGHHKRLCSANYLPGSCSEFEDLEDLGNFSQNSDHWNAFIEKLKPEAGHNLNEVGKYNEDGKTLPAQPRQDPASILNSEIKIKKHTIFSEHSLQPHPGKFQAYNAPDHNSSIEENHIEKYLDIVFNMKKEKDLFIANKFLKADKEKNAVPQLRFETGLSLKEKERKVGPQSLQQPEDSSSLGYFDLQERNDQVDEESFITKKKKTLKSHGASPAITFSTVMNEADFHKLKDEEDVFFGKKGKTKIAEEVTMTGLECFFRGLTNYAKSFPTQSCFQSKNVKFQKYFEEHEINHKKFGIPFSRFLSHDEESFDKTLLNELKGVIEKKKDYGYKSSVKDFFLILEYIMKKNKEDYLLIKESELHDLFSKPSSFFLD
ncbi:hypothetical protein PPACK8108_LOCUS11760 [Phakopsora pachyrhizi]|uniref:Uncharacterized protein n=1 Tax=Phakopsora pachyrhizi TaxID=170000 RepID=A0AAV0B2N8_PHAPC|nr:hypothetical protein PPACK8108_LOCUS11760 [Phakopsora pachyrhizi]